MDSEEDEAKRRKRQANTEGSEVDPDMEEVQSMWRDMWDTFVHGAKKIVKKIAEKFEREAEETQPESEYYNN
jgi:F0F1-type ATP synthase membrane subunit b/b'